MYKKILILFLFIITVLRLWSQEGNQINELDSASFQALRDELDYSATIKKWMIRKYEPDEEEKSDKPINTSWLNESGLVRFLALAAALLLIMYLGFLVFRKIKIPDKKTDGPDDPAPMSPEEPSDPWKEYQWAVENGRYREAIRYHFGLIIKELTEKNIIHYEIFKTNYDYLKEIRDRELKWAFKKVAQIYERIWYGNHHPDFSSFQVMDSNLSDFRNLTHEK